MQFWRLTPGQRFQLGRVVRRREVVDVGAGDGSLARLCLELGASKVLALDKEYDKHKFASEPVMREPWAFGCLFDQAQLLPNQVALVSWPDVSPHVARGILRMTEGCATIVYIGFNDQFTACGTPEFFTELERRYGAPTAMDRNQHMRFYGAGGLHE